MSLTQQQVSKMNILSQDQEDFGGFDFLELISQAFKQQHPNADDYLKALNELTARGEEQRAWLN